MTVKIVEHKQIDPPDQQIQPPIQQHEIKIGKGAFPCIAFGPLAAGAVMLIITQ